MTEEPKSKATIPLYHGGLLRCCTQSLYEFSLTDNYKEDEGTRLACNYCKRETMVVKDGAWRWTGRA